MSKYTKQTVSKIAEFLGFTHLPEDWHGIDPVMPMLEKIKSDGAIFILKLDGERNSAAGEPAYTILISGAPLGDDFIRMDAKTLEDGLIFAMGAYAEKVWGFTPH